VIGFEVGIWLIDEDKEGGGETGFAFDAEEDADENARKEEMVARDEEDDAPLKAVRVERTKLQLVRDFAGFDRRR
jgi:hypothetical protein